MLTSLTISQSITEVFFTLEPIHDRKMPRTCLPIQSASRPAQRYTVLRLHDNGPHTQDLLWGLSPDFFGKVTKPQPLIGDRTRFWRLPAIYMHMLLTAQSLSSRRPTSYSRSLRCAAWGSRSKNVASEASSLMPLTKPSHQRDRRAQSFWSVYR